MIDLNEPLKLILSFIIGAVMGLEREENDEKLLTKKKESYAPLGLRTFSLIAILGCISGLLIASFPFVTIFIGVSIFSLLLAYYGFHSYLSKDIGITTEVALIYSYLIGFLIAVEALPIQVTLAISVVLLLMLSRKEQIKGFVADIQQKEIHAFTSFAVIALVILPFLPNQGYTLSDIPNLERILENFTVNFGKLSAIEIINPFKLWTIVALITGVDLFGYVLERFAGKNRGWLLASLAGGFISSTATTLSLAGESKGAKAINHLVSAAIFANMASFFQIGLIIAVLSAGFFVQSIPVLLLLILSSLGMGIYFYQLRKQKGAINVQKHAEKTEIINLAPALAFALVYLVIQFGSKVALEFFGENGFLIASALGALSGLDAVIVNSSQLAGDRVSYSLAVGSLILANAVNLSSKTIYSFLHGKREFAVKFGISMGVVILSSLLGLLFV